MFIGHLPAGYIVTKLLAGILGAIAPDFDMFYFYLIDNRQHHHHTYWPHFPIIWVSLLTLFDIGHFY